MSENDTRSIEEVANGSVTDGAAAPVTVADAASPEGASEATALDGSGADQSIVDQSGAGETGADQSGAVGPASARPVKVDRLEAEGDIAADYLEELLDIADLDGDLDIDVDGDRAAVSIVGADLQQLVGPNGEVLDALQELTRLAVYRETGERSRLMLDISGHRAERRAELERLAAAIIAEVRASGEKVSMAAMTPFERKVVHDAVAGAGLQSESEGAEPHRHVVILPA